MGQPHKKVEYINVAPYPIYVGVTNCPKAFKAELVRLKIKEEVSFINERANATTHFLSSKKAKVTAIICIGKKGNATSSQYMALIVHESVHVWQEIKRIMNEDKPGDEIEAYAIQWITQCCFDALRIK